MCLPTPDDDGPPPGVTVPLTCHRWPACDECFDVDHPDDMHWDCERDCTWPNCTIEPVEGEPTP